MYAGCTLYNSTQHLPTVSRQYSRQCRAPFSCVQAYCHIIPRNISPLQVHVDPISSVSYTSILPHPLEVYRPPSPFLLSFPITVHQSCRQHTRLNSQQLGYKASLQGGNRWLRRLYHLPSLLPRTPPRLNLEALLHVSSHTLNLWPGWI